MPGPIRTRIEQSTLLAELLGRLLAGYLRLCHATGRWQGEGEDALNAALADGPVTVICWHGRLMMAPVVWKRRARVAVPGDPSPAGQVSKAAQARLGTEVFPVSLEGGNFALVRTVIKLVRSGASLGLAADGPEGPNRQAKRAPIDWARAAGRPVFVFAWSSRRVIRLGTWDRMLIPVPFGGGHYVYRQWDEAPQKAPQEADYAAVQHSLNSTLDGAAADADRAAGLLTED